MNIAQLDDVVRWYARYAKTAMKRADKLVSVQLENKDVDHENRCVRYWFSGFTSPFIVRRVWKDEQFIHHDKDARKREYIRIERWANALPQNSDNDSAEKLLNPYSRLLMRGKPIFRRDIRATPFLLGLAVLN